MSSSSSSEGKFRSVSLDEIKDATDNFKESNVLGHGGEGKVYLAKIKLGWNITQVAVKHLKPNSQEFYKEINTISKIQHPNLVSLLGYCDESGQKILLYEYMEKGSLSDYVKKKSSISLSWMQRLRICLDAARGLQHLHVETDEFPKGIIHRDVKPDNILIGKDWVAKISDFGMFKLSHAGQVQSTMITNLKGTGGYYAPEYVTYRSITRKIDVYAFGVVLFQVLCLKMPWDRGDESYYSTDDEDLGVWAQQNVDAKIKADISADSLKTFTAIIGETLKRDPRKRPTMDGVVLELEKGLKCQEREEAKKAQAATEFDQHSTTACSHRGSRREAEEEEAPETAAAEDEDTGAQVAPIVKLQEVAVSTCEEEENVLIDLKGKLYIFDKEGDQWKERGVGRVKLLKHKETSKVRLVMRQYKTLKICANHIVTPAISVQEHALNEKSCVWHTDNADGEFKEELFCIRFSSIEDCKSFKETIEEVTELQKKTTKEEVEEADSAANLLGNLTVKESKDEDVKPKETAATTEEKKESTVTSNNNKSDE